MGQRQDLLAGARRCIEEKGYSRTTARDITAASGANLAAIGYHFGSKEALLNAAVLESFDAWGDAIEEAATGSATGDPIDRLERFLDGLLTGAQANHATIVASIQALAEAEFVPEVRRQIGESYAEGRRSLAGILLGVDAADVADEDLALGSLALAIVNGLVLQWLVDDGPLPSAEQVAGALRRLVPEA